METVAVRSGRGGIPPPSKSLPVVTVGWSEGVRGMMGPIIFGDDPVEDVHEPGGRSGGLLQFFQGRSIALIGNSRVAWTQRGLIVGGFR